MAISLSILALSVAPSLSKEVDLSALAKSFRPEQTPAQAMNRFTVRSFDQKPEPIVDLQNVSLVVSLMTPLNSKLNREGDLIRAEVVSSSTTNGAPWLPKGTILEGSVEGAHNSTFCRTDGRLFLRFYTATINGNELDVNIAPSAGGDRWVHPAKSKMTKKAMVRNALMAATFIAVPLAIGTGGTSLAITAGAGAVIGGVLADDGKHLQGAVNGAWEGSG
ncbi:MAG: hypothetical protein ACRD3W_09450, partial [Terriglobales bacterium]